MSIIEKIKSFFGNKTKALPAGTKMERYGGAMNENTQETRTLTPYEALKENWILGTRELRLKCQIEERKYQRNLALESLINSKFEDASPLEKTCILLDQSSYISSIIESYFTAKLADNEFNHADININPEEIISFINCIEEMGEGLETQHTELVPVEQKLLGLLTPQQKDIFYSLGDYSRSTLLEKASDDPCYIKTMLNAVSVYMKNNPKKGKNFDVYKEYLGTEERK